MIWVSNLFHCKSCSCHKWQRSHGKMLEARQDKEKLRSTAPLWLKEATLFKGNDLQRIFCSLPSCRRERINTWPRFNTLCCKTSWEKVCMCLRQIGGTTLMSGPGTHRGHHTGRCLRQPLAELKSNISCHLQDHLLMLLHLECDRVQPQINQK